MACRDRNTDSGRLGDAVTSRADSELWPQDLGISTIADENALGGFRKTDLPVGGPAPRDKFTYGSAEAE